MKHLLILNDISSFLDFLIKFYLHWPGWSASGSENKDPQVQGVDYQNLEWNRTGGWNFLFSLLLCNVPYLSIFYAPLSKWHVCLCLFFTFQVTCLFVTSISFGKCLIKGIKPVILREILNYFWNLLTLFTTSRGNFEACVNAFVLSVLTSCALLNAVEWFKTVPRWRIPSAHAGQFLTTLLCTCHLKLVTPEECILTLLILLQL